MGECQPRAEGGWRAPPCLPLLQAAFLPPRAEAGTWEASHSSALKWNLALSSAAGLSSASCPDKTGRAWASFILKDEI